METLNFKDIKPSIKASKYLSLRSQIAEGLSTTYGVKSSAAFAYILSKFTDIITQYQDKNIFPKEVFFLNYSFKAEDLEIEDYTLGKKQYDQITKQIFSFLGVPITKKLFQSLSAAVSVTYLRGENLSYENLAKNFKGSRHASVGHFKTYTQLEYAAKQEKIA